MPTVTQKKVEILAPAGSFETLRTAICAGADSVYLGVGDFNMRASAAKNFQLGDLKKISKLCKENNVKCYVTVNSLVYDEEMDLMKSIVNEVKKVGLDAIIAADWATILYANKVGVEVHASTQLSVSNFETIKFYSKYVDRFVLARELRLEQVKKISEQIKEQEIKGPRGDFIELEMFIHGALCVAVSGRCAMSLFCYDSSANRGKCTHICRRKYKVIDEETGQELKVDNNYVMSSADLCTIGMLDKIIDAGATVLKIEGRGRTPDYVDTVVKTYKEALEAIDKGNYNEENIKKWNKRLGTVFNRGFTKGFYMGRKFDEWAKSEGNKATKRRIQIGKVINYFSDKKVVLVEIQADEVLEEGEEFNITGETTGLVKGKIEEMRVDDKRVRKVRKGDFVTFKIGAQNSVPVRRNDKVFVVRKFEKT